MPAQIAFSIQSALALVGQSHLRDYLASVHASVNSLARFHAVRATGCLFGKLVERLC